MNTNLKRLTTVCAGAFLFAACADLGHRAAARDAGRRRPRRRPTRPTCSDAASTWRAAIDGGDGVYQAALQADPRHVNARNGLATLYAEQGDFAKAIPIWQQLTARSGGQGRARQRPSCSVTSAMRTSSAATTTAPCRALEKACLLDPLNHRAWNHLGSALEKLGQPERAQLMYKQAAALRAARLQGRLRAGQAARSHRRSKRRSTPARAEDGVGDHAKCASSPTACSSCTAYRPRLPRQTSGAACRSPRAGRGAGCAAGERRQPRPRRRCSKFATATACAGMAQALSHKMDRRHAARGAPVEPAAVRRAPDAGRIPAGLPRSGRAAGRALRQRGGGRSRAACKPANMRLVIGRDIVSGKFALQAGSPPRGCPRHVCRNIKRAPVRARHNEEDSNLKPGASP